METMHNTAGKYVVKLVKNASTLHSLTYEAEATPYTIVRDMKAWKDV